MTFRLTWIAIGLLSATACGGGGGATTNVDAHRATVDGPATDGTVNANACTSYTSGTIATMRMSTSGCYSLPDVVSIGTLSSATTPKLFVQDPAGGDYSAMLTTCSSTSTTHPCSVSAAVAAIPDSESVTITGTYIRSSGSTYEEFLIDNITDNGPGTAPAPKTATLAQIERSSTATNLRFQHVTLTLTSTNELKMYDWTPAEFANTTAIKCAYQYGFGMISKAVTPAVTAGSACTNGTTQPTGITTPNAAEVLIGTDFYKGVTISSDCRCAKTYMDMEPMSSSVLTGTIGGLLVFDVPYGATTGYYYLDPKIATDAPITPTMAGM